jgi:hypothetical protein
MNTNSYIMSGDTISMVINGTPYTLGEDHRNRDRILEALKAEDWDSIPEMIDLASTVINYSNGALEVVDGRVQFDGFDIDETLSERILKMIEEGFPVDFMVRFLTNLFQNPSHRSVHQLYGFLEKGQLPITPDGCFLAFKIVNRDYKDHRTRSFDNSVGKVVKMARHQVDEDPNQTCSSGLHFCSIGYLPHYHYDGDNSRVLILKINPRDVVAIPRDYNDSKGRCCQYEVVGEVEDPAKAFSSTTVADWASTQEWANKVAQDQFEGADTNSSEEEDLPPRSSSSWY